MPLPKVSGGESEQDYVSRCIAAQSGEDKPEDQKAAICYSTYREAKKADGLRDNVEKAALSAGVNPELAKAVAQDAVHSYFEVQKTLKVRSLAHLVKSLAINMVSQVRKDFKESEHPRADDGKFGSGGGGKSESRRPELEGTYEERYQKKTKGEKSADFIKRDLAIYKESLSKYKGIRTAPTNQKAAIKQYTGDDYRRINEYARSGSDSSGREKEFQKVIDGCSEYIDKNRLAEKVQLFRGLPINLQIEPGDELPVEGVASFSSSDDVATTFTSFMKDSSIMEISGRPGDPMAPVNGHSKNGNKEAEYIMKPGTNLRCVGKKKVGKQTVYTMEIAS